MTAFLVAQSVFPERTAALEDDLCDAVEDEEEEEDAECCVWEE